MARPAGTRYIESPEMLWECFEAYNNKIKNSPIRVKDWVGKDGDMVYREKERPLTMVGFEAYMFKEGIINDLGDYFSNKGGKYSDFSTICSRIKACIQADQIEGGMAGIYNPSITQRLNGLTEKVENKDEVKHSGSIETNVNINIKRNRE
jgi:hypothetical protein